MNTHLKENIKRRITVRSLSVSELERRAGLKQSTIQNILHGRSKNPSIETIKSIAQELNCSIEELIGDFSFSSQNSTSKPVSTSEPNEIEDKSPWNAELYIKAIQMVQSILDKTELKLPKKQILAAVDEVYRYSIGVSEEIDRRFAGWIIDKIIKNQ